MQLNAPSPIIYVEGDWMLDSWLDVEPAGFAQEAAIPKWKMKDVHRMDGGAGNVVANLVELGADPIYSAFEAQDLPQKFRLVHDGRVVVRWDIDQPVTPLPENWLKLLSPRQFAGLVLSDYAKGRFSELNMPLVDDFPVFCDTRTPSLWMNAVYDNWYFFPNMKEYQTDKDIYNKMIVGAGVTCIVTRGVNGADIVNEKGSIHIPSPDPALEPVSVCGAGDVVVAVVAHLTTKGAPIDFAVAEAMRLAARCVRRPYTCCVRSEDLNAD